MSVEVSVLIICLVHEDGAEAAIHLSDTSHSIPTTQSHLSDCVHTLLQRKHASIVLEQTYVYHRHQCPSSGFHLDSCPVSFETFVKLVISHGQRVNCCVLCYINILILVSVVC